MPRPARERAPDAAGPALFVQPHYDDVALSCGGLVAARSERGDVATVVTVFASELVAAMVDDFAAWKHSRWQVEDIDAVVRQRRAEDAAAARTLGVQLRWLGMPDAIYRGGRYASDRALFGPIHDEELALPRALASELSSLPEFVPGMDVFVPLGAGNHVDHQIVFEAGCELASRGARVYAYVDCPYAIHTPDAVERRMAEIGSALAPEVTVRLPREAIERRIAAVGCYTSQVPVIFRFTDDFARTLREHAMDPSTGALVERFWPVLPRARRP